jgi:DNA-damage-inducible protein D
MSTNQLSSNNQTTFESIKKVNQHGIEYWSARDLQQLLGYTEWRKFDGTIKKAIKSCEQSGNKSPLIKIYVNLCKHIDLF